jgi:NAD(P)-dependent dehydrogenase (short-subunit alcohol dehydrogenase family)
VLAAVRKQEGIESLLAEARTRRVEGSVEPIILDVTVASQITAVVETVRVRIAAGGRLHAIVHNAGAQWAGPIETMPLTEWRSQFDVTFFGPIALTQQLLPQLRASRGRVINVTSIGGIMPGPMIFNLSGEGIADDPPGGDGAPSPNPLPDRDGCEALRVPQTQPSRPLDGCDHLPAGWSAAAGDAGNTNVRGVNLVRPAEIGRHRQDAKRPEN